MPIVGAKIKGLNCFTEEFCGFDEFRAINVIIGRNNTGKSQLVKLVEILCADERRNTDNKIIHEFRAILDESEIDRAIGSIEIFRGSRSEQLNKIRSKHAPPPYRIAGQMERIVLPFYSGEGFHFNPGRIPGRERFL